MATLTRIQKPQTLSTTHDPVVQTLRDDPAFKRLSGFVDGESNAVRSVGTPDARLECFKLYAPRLHALYEQVLDALCDRDENLCRPFGNSAFAATTFNLGPRVETYVHTDHLNFAAGWCGVVALGNFDAATGGHMVLWDLGLLIEFPPGSLIFLPSAILRHANAAIAPHETRYSFTQYSAGGLFRWVECGFQSQKTLEAQGGRLDGSGWSRWVEGIRRLPNIAEWGVAGRNYDH